MTKTLHRNQHLSRPRGLFGQSLVDAGEQPMVQIVRLADSPHKFAPKTFT